MRRTRFGIGVATVFAMVVITTTLALRAQQPQANQTYDPHLGDGFILGTVVEAVTGQPVPGATVDITYGGPVTNAVQLSLPQQPDGIPPAGVPRRVLTDAQGHFFFRQLGAGRYLAQVSAPGYLAQLKPGETIQYIDLDDGAKRTDIVLKLWKCGAISGTVLDENGEPAVGAAVRVLERDMSGGLPQLLVLNDTTTDDRGVYRVSGLGAGPYIVGVIARATSVPADYADAYATTQSASGPTPNPGAPRLPAISGLRIGNSVFDVDAKHTGWTIPPPGPDGKIATYATTFFPNAASSGEATPI